MPCCTTARHTQSQQQHPVQLPQHALPAAHPQAQVHPEQVQQQASTFVFMRFSVQGDAVGPVRPGRHRCGGR